MAAKVKKIKKKSNRSAMKRFRLTASGQVRRAKARHQHNTGSKDRKRKRRLRHQDLGCRAERRRVTRLITS